MMKSSLVHTGQQHVAEADGSDPVVDLFEVNEVLLERIGDEEQALLQSRGLQIEAKGSNYSSQLASAQCMQIEIYSRKTT